MTELKTVRNKLLIAGIGMVLVGVLVGGFLYAQDQQKAWDDRCQAAGGQVVYEYRSHRGSKTILCEVGPQQTVRIDS